MLQDRHERCATTTTTATERASAVLGNLPTSFCVPSCASRKFRVMRVDPWEKAAECGRAMEAANDPHKRAVLGNLQKLWIALGNEEGLLNDQQLMGQRENLYRLHAQFLPR
jgi:hypothetical protein